MIYWLGIIGCWIFADGIYSWSLYHNASTYGSNVTQTFLRDHWLRLVRIIIGVAIMIIGGIS